MRIALLFAVMLAACSKTKADQAADEFRGFRDRMCACETADCKQQVADDYRAWGESEIGKEMGRQRGAWIDDVEKQMRDCRRR